MYNKSMDKLFVYGVDNDAFNRIKDKVKKVKVYALDDSVLYDTVHEVVDVPYMLYTCSEKTNAFLILESDDCGSAWKYIIDDLKRVPNCPKMIKISVTPQNRKWPMHILFEHVLQEDQLFKLRFELKDKMIESANLMKDKMTQEYQYALANAFKVYDNQEASLYEVKEALNQLNAFCAKS